MNQIYTKKNYKVYNKRDSFIIHNTKKPFEEAHTHIKGNLHTCIYLIDLSIHKTIPKRLSKYMINSLIRLSDDENYTSQLSSLILNH